MTTERQQFEELVEEVRISLQSFKDEGKFSALKTPELIAEFILADRQARASLQSRPATQDFVTSDGSASTLPRDAEWCEAIDAAGSIQINGFRPIEIINIAALRLPKLEKALVNSANEIHMLERSVEESKWREDDLRAKISDLEKQPNA